MGWAVGVADLTAASCTRTSNAARRDRPGHFAVAVERAKVVRWRWPLRRHAALDDLPTAYDGRPARHGAPIRAFVVDRPTTTALEDMCATGCGTTW